jgi:hypothetical protein
MKTSTDRTTLCEIWKWYSPSTGTIKTKYLQELSKQKNIKIICFALFRSYSGRKYIGGKYIDLTMQKGILL